MGKGYRNLEPGMGRREGEFPSHTRPYPDLWGSKVLVSSTDSKVHKGPQSNHNGEELRTFLRTCAPPF